MNARVMLVDAHAVTRTGFRVLLETRELAKVVGEAGDARSAYELADREKPDVAVLEVRLPGEDGIAAIRELKRRVNAMRFLVTASSMRRDQVRDALAAGAHGLALKDQREEELLAAFELVARGATYLAPELAMWKPEGKRTRDDNTPLGGLSHRERDICDLFLRGFTSRDVARELCISIKTVETHRTHIYAKLGVHSMTDLVRYAARNAVLPDL